jgi:hypothetical protein
MLFQLRVGICCPTRIGVAFAAARQGGAAKSANEQVRLQHTAHELFSRMLKTGRFRLKEYVLVIPW